MAEQVKYITQKAEMILQSSLLVQLISTLLDVRLGMDSPVNAFDILHTELARLEIIESIRIDSWLRLLDRISGDGLFVSAVGGDG